MHPRPALASALVDNPATGVLQQKVSNAFRRNVRVPHVQKLDVQTAQIVQRPIRDLRESPQRQPAQTALYFTLRVFPVRYT